VEGVFSHQTVDVDDPGVDGLNAKNTEKSTVLLIIYYNILDIYDKVLYNIHIIKSVSVTEPNHTTQREREK